MQDLTPNTPEGNPIDNSGENESDDLKYEMITPFIDGEIKDDKEKEVIKKQIESDNNFHNRYIFEKLTKENFRKRSGRIQTPVYMYKNIGQGIDDYIKKATPNQKTAQEIHSPGLINQENIQKSNLRRNLIYSSFAFLILIASAFLINNALKRNGDIVEKDLVSVSRNIFEKVKAGQIDLKFKSANAKELSDTMDKYLDFKVYIPDVKDAVLIGGVCNEINGQKLAHFVYKKGNMLIYTLEADKEDVLDDDEKIILGEQFKNNVKQGKNWFPCTKENSKNAVVWYKDNVICSSVSDMDYRDITIILSNSK